MENCTEGNGAMTPYGPLMCLSDTDLKLKALLYWKAKDARHSHVEVDCTEGSCQGGSFAYAQGGC